MNTVNLKTVNAAMNTAETAQDWLAEAQNEMNPQRDDNADFRTELPKRVCKPQLRILKVLAELAPRETIDQNTLADLSNVWPRKINALAHQSCRVSRQLSLAEQGLVKVTYLELDGGSEKQYAITAAGRKALAKLQTIEE